MAELKKIIIFDGKKFYNARHLYNYLMKYYGAVHPVTYYQVEDATGKRLKSIDKFYKVTYDYVSVKEKESLKRWRQIVEGKEEIIAFEVKCFDDFIIKYAAAKDTRFIYTFKNTRKEIMLAYKPDALMKLAKIYDKVLYEKHYWKIYNDSEIQKFGYRYYQLKPTPIKQNIF